VANPRVTDGLIIKGNVLINNPKKGREIGLGLADACPDSGGANATCTVAQVGQAGGAWGK
jgi:hypothetical protein